jgi:tripartite-type tricarboxylate transporter receptor subunit TctC
MDLILSGCAGARALWLSALMLCSLLVGAPTLVHAQQDNWPTRPIKIIAGVSPGSSTDLLARTFGRYLSERTGQPVIVDNKPGGNAIIGAEAAKNSAPDGYTFYMGSVSTQSANPAAYAKLPYDPQKDFVEVGMFMEFPYFVVVRKDSKYESIDDIVAAAKANAKPVSCGYSTIGSRLPCEMLKVRAGVDIVVAAYKSTPPVLQDVAAGVIDFTIIDSTSATIAMKGGLIKVIGVTTAKRLPMLSHVKTVAESFPGFVHEGWTGLTAPAGTPPRIVERMNAYMREALEKPALREAIEGSGALVRVHSVQQQAAYVRADQERWKKLLRDTKIPPMD